MATDSNAFMEVPGRPTSAELRQGLRSVSPVLLAFSRGKDSLAAWLALRETTIEVIPYFMYPVPHMRFLDESVHQYEEFFGQHIIQIPHPALYNSIRSLMWQPPEHMELIRSFDIPRIHAAHLQAMLRATYAKEDTWVATGVRGADSPQRRVAVVRHGPVNERERTIMTIWDWKISHVRAILARHNCPLPVDYTWFGRTYDGFDYRFSAPLKRNVPATYEYLKEWFPLLDAELFRYEVKAKALARIKRRSREPAGSG